jgi:hypothetical protein
MANVCKVLLVLMLQPVRGPGGMHVPEHIREAIRQQRERISCSSGHPGPGS